MSAIKFKIGNTWSDLVLDLVYPVGSLYMSINSTSPAILFGGSWAAIENRMIIGASTTYAAGNTGGSATTTISSANLPTHTHSVGAHSHGLNSHKHSVGAHSHGLNSHKHSVGAHAHGLNNHTHTFDHGTAIGTNYGLEAGNANWAEHIWMSTGVGTTTITVTSSKASGNTANSTAFDSGAASGSTANSTAFDSGATGGGGAHNNMPPYLAVYTWQRVA